MKPLTYAVIAMETLLMSRKEEVQKKKKKIAEALAIVNDLEDKLGKKQERAEVIRHSVMKQIQTKFSVCS